MAGEACDDQQRLLQPHSLPANRDTITNRSQDSTGSSSGRCCQPAVSCCHRWQSWQLPVASVVLVLASTAMVVTLPVYLQAVNVSGSAYSGALFVWLVVTMFFTVYCRQRYPLSFLRNSLGRGGVLRVLRYGCWHGLACVAVVYALDRKRVLCHAQEPLMGLIVLYIILLYCFYRGPLLSSSKLLCLCGVLAGLFLAMDFQLNDIYLCRGRVRMSPESDGGPWSLQEHALWTVVYAGALFLYALAWIKLEHLLLHMDKHRASNDEVNTVSGQLVMSNATSPPHSPLLLEPSSASVGATPNICTEGQQPGTSGLVNGACQVNGACGGQVNGAYGGQVNGACGGQMNGACGSQVNGACGSQVNGACGSQVNGASGGQVNGACSGQVNGACGGQVNEACDVPEVGADGGQEGAVNNRANSVSSSWREPVQRSSLAGSSASLCSSVSSSMSLFPTAAASHGFTRPKIDAMLFWFVIATLATVLALFWTDFFTALGKSGSAEMFANLTANGLLCHFRGLERCGPTALHGWALVLYMLLFLWGVRALAVSSRSIIFPLSVASVALPLSALFWGAFSEGGPYGIIWAPTVTGELVFSSFGLPVMVACLIYWARLDRLELYKTSASALPRSTPPTRSHDYSLTADRIPTATPSNVISSAAATYDRYRVADTAVVAMGSTMNTPTANLTAPTEPSEAFSGPPIHSIVVDIHENGEIVGVQKVCAPAREESSSDTVNHHLMPSSNDNVPGDAVDKSCVKVPSSDTYGPGTRNTDASGDCVVEFSGLS